MRVLHLACLLMALGAGQAKQSRGPSGPRPSNGNQPASNGNQQPPNGNQASGPSESDSAQPQVNDEQPNLTIDEILQMRSALEEHIEAKVVNNDHPRIGGLVRLAFHDCVGGCDGCVNLANSDNAGLQIYINDLEPVYAPYANLISRADFWQLAGLEALRRAAEACVPQGCNPVYPDIQFRIGRQDCETSPNTAEIRMFPNNGGHGTLNDVLDFFDDAFGLDETGSVALLGAHTLGRARSGDSGFNGPWVGNADLLDNAYFRDLLNRNWIQINIAPANEEARWQWIPGNPRPPPQGRRRRQAAGNGPMMLNSDMCLVKHIIVTPTGQSECNYFSCADSFTIDLVRQYANNNEMWIQDFSTAYTTMIETTVANLMVPGETQSEEEEGVGIPTQPEDGGAGGRGGRD
ncbi:unnamed protein product [Owenia fusiformis]|uniref:Plant heme peroxidase family profile domain-containing protein n=1 Tax=Owenia fusiformis TaxID=6347 RepID=A0A8S4NQK6_OWEFU|nr:unnamed protein product [Owenia fusiformis]